MSAGRFSVTYRIRARRAEAEARALSLAIEQSIEMPIAAVTDARVLDEVVGRVESVAEIADGVFDARVALAAETLDGDVGQFVNMLIGNGSFHADVDLVDFDVPDTALSGRLGPNLGVAGLRRLVGAGARPLTLSNLKPQGLPADELADLAHRLALGGLDFVKDDHGLADQARAPFAERVPKIAAAIARARDVTGRATHYLTHVGGDLDDLRRRLDLVRGLGLPGVLIAPMLVGLPAFRRVVAEHPDLAFMAHPALAGRTPFGFGLFFGRLLRLLGADAVIFPTHGSRFRVDEDETRRLADEAARPWGTIGATMPVPSGGVRFEGLPQLLAFYGPDVMFFLGGSLLASGERLTADTRRFTDHVATLEAPAVRHARRL